MSSAEKFKALLARKLLTTGLVRRFVAGDRLQEALAVVGHLQKRGFLTTLDHLGENQNSKEGIEQSTQEYLEILKGLESGGLHRNISIKLTQIGLDIDPELCFQNLRRILELATRIGGFVRVDMEGSAYTEATLALVKRAHQEYPCVGVVVQSVLRRSHEDVIDLLKHRVRIRLCKGAYKESGEIAFPDKGAADGQFVTLMKRLLTSGIYHGIATHDERIIHATQQFAQHEGIEKEGFEFQMLYGIRQEFAAKLVQEGWRVRIYIPFGKFWLPYMTRRLGERKENLWFVLKNIFRR